MNAKSSQSSADATRPSKGASFTNPFFTVMLGFCIGFGFCWFQITGPLQRRMDAQEESLREWERINRKERDAIATIKSISVEELRKWVATLDEQNTRYAQLQRLVHEQEMRLTGPGYTYIILAAAVVIVFFGCLVFITRETNAEAARTLDAAISVLPALRQSVAERLTDSRTLDAVHQLPASIPARAPNGESQRREGVVVRFDSQKGFGSILPDDGGAEVFFHRNEVTVSNDGTISVGLRVAYRLGTDRKGRPCARNVETIRST